MARGLRVRGGRSCEESISAKDLYRPVYLSPCVYTHVHSKGVSE